MPRGNTRSDQARDGRGRWLKGASGNPRGKPRGTRHRATRAAEDLLEGQAKKLTAKCIELALAGDTTAMKLALERVIPARKDRPVALALPPLEGTPDLPTVTAALLAATAAGELTPGEAGELAKLVEAHRRAVETVSLEARVAALEGSGKP
jgi:hypothetical protein